MRFHAYIREFVRHERAVTAIEYGLIASGVAVVIAGTAWSIGNSISNKFNNIVTLISK
jgi:Flp pilus assembly pilin Flp